jgi:serine/threonine-protein kinase
VQKIGNQIHVNVQLIKAATDSHLWAETYTKELIDLLNAQSEIAQRVAAELNTTLTANEKARIDQKATSDPEAYALYLKGTEVFRRPALSAAHMEEGQRYFEQAIVLDPNFALAHARLAQIHSKIAALFDPSSFHIEKGRAEAEEALRLQPTLNEGHVALGFYFGRVARDYEAAFKEYEIAQRGAPNDAYVVYGIGWTQMKAGRWRSSITNWERATSLDPMNWMMFDNLANACGAVGMLARAERAKRRAADLVPGASTEKAHMEQAWAWTYYALTGSFDKFDEVLARNAAAPDADGAFALDRHGIRMLERNFDDAERAIASSPVTIFELWTGPRVTKNFLLGQVALARGDITKARPLFETELQFARAELNEKPDSAACHAQLGLVCAYLGRKEEAIAEGRRGVELMPVSKDAFEGPEYLALLAEILGRVGEPGEAIDILQKLLTAPNGLIPLALKDWQWDPLRNHPRFQKLVNGPPPKIVYN